MEAAIYTREEACENICRIAGARYVGIQQCWGIGGEDLCLFTALAGGSTFGLRLNVLTPEAVAARIQAARVRA